VVKQFLAAQASFDTTVQETADRLHVSTSVFHGARQHVEAVEQFGADPWMPRALATRMLRERQQGQPSEAVSLIQSALRALDQSAETLPQFDPMVLTGWLNQRTSTKRAKVRRAIGRLRPWLIAVEEGLR
jgi:hypothetical protein